MTRGLPLLIFYKRVIWKVLELLYRCTQNPLGVSAGKLLKPVKENKLCLISFFNKPTQKVPFINTMNKVPNTWS